MKAFSPRSFSLPSAALLTVPLHFQVAATADPGVVADEGIISSLESMGFSREHSAAAARATFNVSTEEAMEWYAPEMLPSLLKNRPDLSRPAVNATGV